MFVYMCVCIFSFSAHGTISTFLAHEYNCTRWTYQCNWCKIVKIGLAKCLRLKVVQLWCQIYLCPDVRCMFSFIPSTVIAWWLQWLSSGAMYVVYALQCLQVIPGFPVRLRHNPIGS